MRAERRKVAVRCVRAIALFLALLAFAGAASAQVRPRFLWGEGTPRYLAIPGGDPEAAFQQARARANIPQWRGSFTFQGQTFQYTMVGTDPGAGSATTTIPVVIIPLKFAFADGTSLSATDPVCGGSSSAVDLVQHSPIFQQASFAPGGTDVGTTQYIDAFQRANFWSDVTTASPDYHVLLSPTVMPTQTITVPASSGHTQTGPCARIGHVDISFFDKTAKKLILQLGIPRTSLPLFLDYNTFWTQGGCCILGYHSVTLLSHTYAVAAYNDAGIFDVPIEDIHALSHELGEWLDDPFVNNATPPWTGGQASGCQANLEVGDPVTGIAFTVVLNDFTYHPEDLVFLAWFARQTPSTAVNGWYTFLNTYTSAPPVCH
jgi:hypothetical protein